MHSNTQLQIAPKGLMLQTSADALQNLLPWSSPSRVSMKQGSMIVRTAKADANFKRIYKASRASFEDAGVSIRKTNEGEIVEWRRDLLSENMGRKAWEKEVKAFVRKNLNFKVNMKGLFPYQEIAVKRNVYALKEYGYAHEGSDTGYGKTYVAFAVARHCGLRLGVIAPKATLTVWERVSKHMGMRDKMFFNWKRGKQEYCAINIEKLKTGKSGWGHFEEIVENGQIVDKWVWTVPDDVMLVFDELHRFKGVESQNSKAFIAASAQSIPTMGMSATAANDPTHMRGLGMILGLHDGSYHDFYRWARENGCAEAWSGQLKFYGGLHVLSQLHKDIFPEHGNRQRVADLDDFPETRITADTYDMGGNTKHIKKAYQEMQRELDLIAAKHAMAKNPLVVLLRARQKVELLKVPAMVEMTQDAVAEDNSVVIFVNFEETVQQLARQLKTECIIHGGQSAVLRQYYIDQFNADKERIIICNIRAGGVGISLHDLNGRYARMALISPSYSAQDLVQALGRVHRAGGKTKSIQKIIFAAGTIEEQVCQNVNEKLQMLNTLNDGDMNAGVNLF
jgi:superfamily II DNA or RNA helicase